VAGSIGCRQKRVEELDRPMYSSHEGLRSKIRIVTTTVLTWLARLTILTPLTRLALLSNWSNRSLQSSGSCLSI